MRFLLTAAYTHELVALACDSPTGRQALRDVRFGQRAAHQISEARRWVRQATFHMPPEAAGAAIASLLINQAFFVASHGAVSSSGDLFPATASLRDCLHDGHTDDWLRDQDVALPQWLTEEDD